MENLYSQDLTSIYDPITEDIYTSNNEGDLVSTRFYYFNMQKDQEDYLRDLDLKKQEKIANRNNQGVSSYSIRTFRKKQGNFTIFDGEAEFNQYPKLDKYKVLDAIDQEYEEPSSPVKSTENSLNSKSKRLFEQTATAKAKTRNFKSRALQTQTARNKSRSKYNPLCDELKEQKQEQRDFIHKRIIKQSKNTQKVIAIKNSRLKKEAEMAMLTFQIKKEKMAKAVRLKEQRDIEAKTNVMMNRYNGIDDFLQRTEKVTIVAFNESKLCFLIYCLIGMPKRQENKQKNDKLLCVWVFRVTQATLRPYGNLQILQNSAPVV